MPTGIYLRKFKAEIRECCKCKNTTYLMINKNVILKQSGVIKRRYLCRNCNTKNMQNYLSNPDNRKKYNKNKRIYNLADYKFKGRARHILKYAIDTKKITKPNKCLSCENTKVEAHHNNYKFPLKVIWLCKTCHANKH